ncbi:MAG: glycine zipper 2TM domain-containing protein [Gammaproteobacteria bacterium]|nr:glycine zipper 2TM domain-containing protein [Gammaproteobacteria bacterium]
MSVIRMFALLLLAPGIAFAATSYDYADVLGVEPIYETVSYAVPHEQCYDERVAVHHGRGHHSSTAPIFGAIIGGVIGNAVGHHKRNKQVGTLVGALLGGSIGADIARQHRYRHGRVSYHTEQVCTVVNTYDQEERLVGYRVRYRYAGETYSTRMNRDPGDRLRVRVRVTPAG